LQVAEGANVSLPQLIKSIFRIEESQGPRPAVIIEQLNQYQVLVPTRPDVEAYVAMHPELGELLPEICNQVRQSLGQDAELSLELYRDPEFEDRYLTLYVRQRSYDAHIMDKIEAVSQRFNDKLEKVSGYLLLTTDFRRPKVKHVV
jgi:hypothetical protein